MTRCSISMPEDCWAYVDAMSDRLRIPRSSAIAHIIKGAMYKSTMARLDDLEKQVIMLADLVNELKGQVSKG